MMDDLKHLSIEFNQYYNVLREKEAQYAGNIPPDLYNLLQAYEEAIAWIDQTIKGELSRNELNERLWRLPVPINQDIQQIYKMLADTLGIKGISYLEARQIAVDIFEANFLRLANEAAEIAQKRAGEFTGKLLMALLEQSPEALVSFKSPDMMYSLFAAQREYARTGSKDHAEILVNILVDRAKEKDRTLKQIVLNEAVLIASKLTVNQLDILSVIFLIKDTVDYNMHTIDRLVEEIQLLNSLLPETFERRLDLHLQYTGCCNIGKAKWIVPILQENYPGLFHKGFEKQKFYDIFDTIEKGEQFGDEVLVPCFHNPELWQPKPEFLEVYAEKLSHFFIENNLNHETAQKIQALFRSSLMTPQEANVCLHQIVPEFNELAMNWHTYNLAELELTTVGIAIAQANLQRKGTTAFDLDKWLSYRQWQN